MDAGVQLMWIVRSLISKPVDAAIGTNVAAIRNLLRLPLDRVATQLGVSNKVVEAWEAGRRKISPRDLFRLSKLMKVPVSAFFNPIEVHDEVAS